MVRIFANLTGGEIGLLLVRSVVGALAARRPVPTAAKSERHDRMADARMDGRERMDGRLHVILRMYLFWPMSHFSRPFSDPSCTKYI